MEIQDKIFIITGGSRGLGKEMAKVAIGKGAKVVISSHKQEELGSTAKEIGATAFTADVTNEEQVQALADFAVQEFGQINVWINNAGIWLDHMLAEEMPIGKVRQMMEVNVIGLILGSQKAIIQMKEQKSGAIVNILSTSALEGRPNSSGYCASKYGAKGFTKSIRKELVGFGIKIIGVYPDGMKTKLFGEEAKHESYDNFMEPADVAKKIITNLEQESPEQEQIIRRER